MISVTHISTILTILREECKLMQLTPVLDWYIIFLILEGRKMKLTPWMDLNSKCKKSRRNTTKYSLQYSINFPSLNNDLFFFWPQGPKILKIIQRQNIKTQM